MGVRNGIKETLNTKLHPPGLRFFSNREYLQTSGFFVLIIIILITSACGIYALFNSPYIGLKFLYKDEKWIVSHIDPFGPSARLNIFLGDSLNKIEGESLGKNDFLIFPEFFFRDTEKEWWQRQERLYELSINKDSITLELNQGDNKKAIVSANLRNISLIDAIKKAGLIYMVALIYMIIAISIFYKQPPLPNLLCAYLFAFMSLYLTSAAPVVSRDLTLTPFLFKLFIKGIYFSAGGFITLVHLSLIFPRPKIILKTHPRLVYILYIYFSITVFLYFSKVITFGVTFPFLCFWTLIMIMAFLHSWYKENDLFLRKQILLGLVAPVIVGLLFVLFNLLPNVIGKPSIDFSYFAVFSLILPFSLSFAIENQYLYQDKIERELGVQREKAKMGRELHDNLSNDLMNIKFLSEVADQSLSTEHEKTRESIRLIKETSVRNMERLRDFLWAIDPEEDTCEDMIAHFNSYSSKLFNALNIDSEFKYNFSSQTSRLSTYLRFNLFNIYKEVISNIIKHSNAKRVVIEMSGNDRGLELKIADDGKGFDPDNNSNGHYGLKNIRGRAEDIGATFNISSAEGTGTRIHLILRAV